jgi:uncharacterized protein
MDTDKKDLTNKLIKNVQPYLNPGEYVFLSLPEARALSPEDIVCMFHEKEGTTYVVDKSIADSMNLYYNFNAAWITLNVYSSLEAVGLTAKVASALAAENISCNAIAAYNHDHVFVPYKHADKAMALLRKLQ